jgi:hypothetical protein
LADAEATTASEDRILTGREGDPVERTTRIASAVTVAVLAAVLGGCTFTTPQETKDIEEVVNGTNADVGHVEVRNAIALTRDGDVVSLSMTVLNAGERQADVRFSYPTTGGHVTQVLPVGPGATVFRGTRPGDEQMLLEDTDARPGALLRVFVDAGGRAGRTLEVPVLNELLPECTDLLPTTPAAAPVARRGATTVTVTDPGGEHHVGTH